MSAIIKTIEDILNNKIYPKTKTRAVYDDSNNRLDQTLSSVAHFENDSSTGTIADPVLKQSDIATTLGTSDTAPASQNLVNTVNTNLGSPSSASSVTGADAFSKISTLNSELTDIIKVKNISHSYTIDNAGGDHWNPSNDTGFSETGYTPLGIIGYISDTTTTYFTSLWSESTGWSMMMHGTPGATGTIQYKVLYLKNLS